MEYSLFMVACIWIGSVWGQDPLVLTSQGLVRGIKADDGDYNMFLGIPYAIVGLDNPFGDALPPNSFNEILEANDDSAICPQRNEFTDSITGNLDCLTVNIFVPTSASSRNQLPVMIWINGEDFKSGFASRSLYGPQHIIRHDVILVTFNYRIGPFGFMCLDVSNVPGNTGLKDQRKALHWINENIVAFGGDVDRITLFGQGAGAVSAQYHILSPGSTEYFHQAILQSGSVFSEFALGDSIQSVPFVIANHFGFTTEDLQEAIKFIGSIPTHDFIAAVEELDMVFKPCVEKQFDGVDSFLPTSPINLFASRRYTNVPILLGYTDDETATHLIQINVNADYLNQYENVFWDKLNVSFNFPTFDELKKASNIMKAFYLGSNEVSEYIVGFINFDADFKVYHPTERGLLYHLGFSGHPIYQYVFAYSGDRNFVKQRYNLTESGACHADEIGYLFMQSYMPQEVSLQDQVITNQLTTMWTNFAKFGNPTPTATESVPLLWPPVTRADREYLVIDSEMRVDRRPFHDRMAFWDLFYAAYGKYQSGCA